MEPACWDAQIASGYGVEEAGPVEDQWGEALNKDAQAWLNTSMRKMRKAEITEQTN